MASRLIDEDPVRADAHAQAAVRRAGRIAIVRQTAGITAYARGEFALALRELRTYRRISGRDDSIALIVDSERGIGRPDRALEEGRAVDVSTLDAEQRVELAIALSGARLDLGQADRALTELDIPELDPDRAFSYSPALFAARAGVLEELGREAEASEWYRRAEIAADAIDQANGFGEDEELIVISDDDDEDEDAHDTVESVEDWAHVEDRDADEHETLDESEDEACDELRAPAESEIDEAADELVGDEADDALRAPAQPVDDVAADADDEKVADLTDDEDAR
ncbi:hypothetical protein RR49_01726 [Microbacterium ginsengisoli]|uniref:Replicase polyprotein 1ab n=1 Tax=Microbacterium ginsengisoli TaxID=400772 RepID=A0A0F0LYC7_9MICO|nr:hypothetical protein [Microbacterium ginsengisoli]KJL36391.1 hypothetical protein RR49_01726 [Microbacterium ginsengisoli]MBN9209707.1 hypothetical protein [Microbacterium ginsengisoli]